MKAEIKTITPEWAKFVLENKNNHNRGMNQNHIARLSKEIVAGRWKINGDTICLNGQRLIDGQHRLAAVVKTGIPIRSFVIEGISSDVFDTKDVGKRRSASDTLSVRGETSTVRLSAALIMVDRYLTGRADVATSYSNTEIEELLEKYPTIRSSIKADHKLCVGLIQVSVIDACHYLFSRKDPELAEEFVRKITKGIGLTEGDPLYILRERLLRNSISKAKLNKVYIFALCIKAWNATRVGSKIRSLRFRESGNAIESFPVIR